MNQDEKRSVIAGLYGNALEWYDFMLYASFTPLFASYFFPINVPFLSLLATFGVFALGFLVRPLGGLVLGHFADRSGRRRALIASVTIMSLSTLSIAFLPGYQSSGIIGPVLFILLRLIQGIAVGGELPGSATFLIEHMPANRRGFAGSLVISTAILGIFAGSFFAAFLSTIFSDSYLYYWGWRWAYILGGVLGLIGIYLRLHSTESAVFLKEKPAEDIPAKIIFQTHKQALLLAVIFTSILAIGNHLTNVYITTFLVKLQGFTLARALTANFLGLLVMILCIPFVGYLSDYVGHRRILKLGLVSLGLLIFPIFYLLCTQHLGYVIFAQVLLGLAMSPINATIPSLLAELFPTNVRTSGVALGYNLGQAIFGGTVPIVALSLVQYTSNKVAPAWYILFITLFAFVATYRLDSNTEPLGERITSQ